MGYNNDGIVKVDQEFFKPFNSRQIQMVGRLVEEQDVRISEKCLCKKHFDFLAAGQVCHLSIMEFGFDSEAIQKSGSIGLCLPSVHLSEFTFKFAGTDTVFVREVFFCVDGFFFFHDFIQSGISHNNGIQNIV